MIDPRYITNYNRSPVELEEFAVFCICVAGKDAKRTAIAVQKLRSELAGGICEIRYPDGRLHSSFDCGDDPEFRFLHEMYCRAGLWGEDNLANLMRICGIGCYNNKCKTCLVLADRLVDRNGFLQTCSVEELENIWGIGSKTARFFILHSRPNVRVAALDTHMLKLLRDNDVDAPKTTPPKGSAKYKELELTALAIADKMGLSPAEFDLKVWNQYSRNGLTYGSKTI
jgi:hypothetical protein